MRISPVFDRNICSTNRASKLEREGCPHAKGTKYTRKNASRKEGCVWEGVKGGKDKSGGERRKEKGNVREKGNVMVRCGRCRNREGESSNVLVEERGKEGWW